MWTLFYNPIKTAITTKTISYKFHSPFSKFPLSITLLFPSHSLNNPLHIKNMINLKYENAQDTLHTFSASI